MPDSWDEAGKKNLPTVVMVNAPSASRRVITCFGAEEDDFWGQCVHVLINDR